MEKEYKINNVLGMKNNRNLGTIKADDIEDALRKAKKLYPQNHYLLQVTLCE